MERTEKPLVIACGILCKEIERLQEKGDIDVETYFLSEKLHMDYNLLDRGLNGALKKYQKESHGGIVVVYGDVCLGFNEEMKALINKYDAVKVDALNCIDCLLGGKGKLLDMDPDHKMLFLNPAFIKFGEKIKGETQKWTREMYSMLDGIVLLDAMGDLNDYQSEIDEHVERTGLPILDRKEIGLDGLKNVLLEALDRNRQKHTVNNDIQTAQLVRDLQHRLASLLEDPVFAKARQDRLPQRLGILKDAISAHNMAISEEILHLDASSVNGVVKGRKIDDFRKDITFYLNKNGSGNQGFDHYIAIVSEYLALVVRQPLHPLELRHLENNPPEETDRRKYCSWKARYIKNDHSLCRYCNCLPWPEATERLTTT